MRIRVRLALAVFLGLASRAQAVCCPVPCNGCSLEWNTQLNVAVMDRQAARMRLVPNIQFRGQARDFALVVPTPALPEFSLAPAAIWTEVLQATQPVAVNNGSASGFGCDSHYEVLAGPASPSDGVTIHAQQTLGGLQATVISSSDAQSLVDWLAAHGYGLQPADAARFAPYVNRGWFFTAMRPDTTTSGGQMPPGGWNAQVQPIVVSYAADTFEVPLDLLAINSTAFAPIVVFAVDDHRMTLDGFTTDYANRVSTAEFSAMQRMYPGLASFLGPGRFLTRLQYNMTGSSPPQGSALLQQAPTDAEFRRTQRNFVGWAGVGPLALLVLVLGARPLRSPQRRRA